MSDIQTNEKTKMESSYEGFSEFDVREYGKPEKVVSEFEESGWIDARKKAWEKELKLFFDANKVGVNEQIKIYKNAEKFLNNTYITVYDPQKMGEEDNKYSFHIIYGDKEKYKISLEQFLEIVKGLA